jgi:FAD/FMN-containing dehydrogenase
MTDQTLLERLVAIVGARQVFSGEQLDQFLTSFWDASPLQAKALVRPGSTEEVSAIMALCHGIGQSVVVRGGLTGPVAALASTDQALAISLERMQAMGPVDLVNSCFVAEAGVILQHAQDHARASGRLLALDLGARGSCTIGGNIATNAGGINVLRYGMARHQILGLEAVLADGTLVSSMTPMLKTNTGYDLNQLFIGSEGTLGIVTRAVLRVHPLPISTQTALVALDSFEAVTKLLGLIKTRLSEKLSAFEVMWSDYFLAQTGPGLQRAPLSRDHNFYVVLECQGMDPIRDGDDFLALMQHGLESGLITDAVVANSERERLALWELRENLDSMLKHTPVYLYDVAVPIDRMADYVATVMASVYAAWPNGRCFAMGHIADGNVHFFVQPRQPATTHEQSDNIVYGSLSSFGGLISAEHGIGREKKAWLLRNRPPEYLATMRRLKAAFDPKALLNPGCVMD